MVENEYVGAIDQGTTGTRFILFDKSGHIISKAYEKHEQIYPKPGWVEHDPVEIWKNTQKVIRDAVEEVNLEKIVSVGVTNQRETTIVWDPKTGNPLHNAIVWQDTRTKEICEKMEDEGLEKTIRDKTGLRIHSYFSGPKIKWILDNVSGVERKVEEGRAVFGNIDSWIIWNLTGGSEEGVHLTDYTNASRTMLMNLEDLDWDDELLNILDIPREILPEIRPSSDENLYGTTSNAPAGLEVPVSGDLGDQQAALFGQTCFEEGKAKNTYGTGCFILVNTGSRIYQSDSGLITTPAYGLEEGKCTYALEGSIPVAGAAIEWLIDNLQIIESASETEEMARSVEDTGGIYFVPAFSGLYAPHWDMSARGTIVGLTGSVCKEHLVRAVLEAICFQTRDMLEAMKKDIKTNLEDLRVDGGVTANDFLLQLQANISGKNIIRPEVRETTSLGVAYAAGLAVDFWNDLESIKKNWRVNKTFEPEWGEDKKEEKYMKWQKAVNKARDWED